MNGRVAGEIDRRLANLIRIGSIASVSGERATVAFGDNETASLPWITRRAGGDVDWWAPEVGEQVLVLSPSGELAQGVILPAIYRDAAPAPTSDPDIRRVAFGDGTVVEYDRAASQLRVDAVGDVDVVAAGNVYVVADGNVVIGGATVKLGSASATDPVVRKSDLDAALATITTWANAHVHPYTAPAPATGPPATPLSVTGTASPTVSSD